MTKTTTTEETLSPEIRKALGGLYFNEPGRDDSARLTGMSPDAYLRAVAGGPVTPDEHARLTWYAHTGRSQPS